METAGQNRKVSSPRRLGSISADALIGMFTLACILGFFLPTFVQAAQRVNEVSCVSNLKQISLAMMMYVQDYDERFPLSRYPSMAGSGLISARSAPEEPIAGVGSAARWQMFWPDMLYPYIKNRQIFRCPANRSAYVGEDPLGDEDPAYRGYGRQNSYAVNAYLCRPGWGISTSAIQAPESLNLLMDARYYLALPMMPCELKGEREHSRLRKPGEPEIPALHVTEGVNARYWKNVGDSYLFRYRKGEPGFSEAWALGRRRHRGFVNVGYADGHVKSRRYEGVVAAPADWDPFRRGCVPDRASDRSQ